MPTKVVFTDMEITVRPDLEEVARELGGFAGALTKLERIHGDEHHNVYINPASVLYLEEVEVGHAHASR